MKVHDTIQRYFFLFGYLDQLGPAPGGTFIAWIFPGEFAGCAG